MKKQTLNPRIETIDMVFGQRKDRPVSIKGIKCAICRTKLKFKEDVGCHFMYRIKFNGTNRNYKYFCVYCMDLLFYKLREIFGNSK